MKRGLWASVGLVIGAAVLAAQNPSQVITIDANADRHSINPNIYGVAFSTTTDLLSLNAPLHRSGGNPETRYNWKINGDNRARDWYFESIGDSSGATTLSLKQRHPARRPC